MRSRPLLSRNFLTSRTGLGVVAGIRRQVRHRHLGDARLGSLDPLTLERYKRDRLAEPHAPGSFVERQPQRPARGVSNLKESIVVIRVRVPVTARLSGNVSRPRSTTPSAQSPSAGENKRVSRAIPDSLA